MPVSLWVATTRFRISAPIAVALSQQALSVISTIQYAGKSAAVYVVADADLFEKRSNSSDHDSLAPDEDRIGVVPVTSPCASASSMSKSPLRSRRILRMTATQTRFAIGEARKPFTMAPK